MLSLGICYAEQGKVKEAEDIWKRTDLVIRNVAPQAFPGVDFSEKHYQVLNNLGQLYFRQKKFQDAVIYYKAATELNKCYFNALANLAACYRYMGDRQAALDSAWKARGCLRPWENDKREQVDTFIKLMEKELENPYESTPALPLTPPAPSFPSPQLIPPKMELEVR
jgi:tetratricopeptide (TPR) repeat protein